MKGAFDEWAESERPARYGGAEKVPAVKQMPRRRHELHEEMEGHGFFSSLGSLASKAVSAVSSGADTVSKVTEFYNKAKEYSPKVKAALRSDMVPSNYRPVATKLAEYMEMVGLGKHKKCPLARHMATECMHRQHSGMYGGASILSIATNAKKVYDWIKENSPAIHTILKLPQLEPYGGKVEGIMSMVGLGKRPSSRHIDAGVMFVDPMSGHHVVKKGKGFFSKLSSGISKGVSAASKAASTASSLYAKAKEYAPAVKDLLSQYGGETGAKVADKISSLGLGRKRRGRAGPKPSYATHGFGGGGPRSGPSARNAIVKEVMQKEGLSLIEASKFVKAHGLYTPKSGSGGYYGKEAMDAGFYN